MNRRRIFSFLLVLSLMTSLFALPASAIEARGSDTLLSYIAIVTPGDDPGEIEVSYDVSANKIADEVGVSSIKIYKSNGTYVTTINGTVSNGLIRKDASCHRSSYVYTGTSGTSYYAVVTVTATIGSKTDSRTITTSSAKAA